MSDYASQPLRSVQQPNRRARLDGERMAANQYGPTQPGVPESGPRAAAMGGRSGGPVFCHHSNGDCSAVQRAGVEQPLKRSLPGAALLVLALAISAATQASAQTGSGTTKADPKWCFSCHHTQDLMCGSCHEIRSQGPDATTDQKREGPSKEQCLSCHGPYDKLAASTAGYKWPKGEKVTPHQYVPHNSTDARDIPECTRCHTPHPSREKADRK